MIQFAQLDHYNMYLKALLSLRSAILQRAPTLDMIKKLEEIEDAIAAEVLKKHEKG